MRDTTINQMCIASLKYGIMCDNDVEPWRAIENIKDAIADIQSDEVREHTLYQLFDEVKGKIVSIDNDHNKRILYDFMTWLCLSHATSQDWVMGPQD